MVCRSGDGDGLLPKDCFDTSSYSVFIVAAHAYFLLQNQRHPADDPGLVTCNISYSLCWGRVPADRRSGARVRMRVVVRGGPLMAMELTKL